MGRKIVFGQYVPGKSVIHKFDCRLKLISFLIIMILLFVAQNFISLALVVSFIFLELFLSKIKLKTYLKSMKFIIIIILITAILNLFYGSGESILSLGFMTITKSSIKRSIFIFLRLIGLVLASSVLTFTTKMSYLTIALEYILKPLSFFKVNVNMVAMMVTITARFIPILQDETEKIIEAQTSRGKSFQSGNIIKRFKSIIAIFIPLILLSFKRAYDFSLAMECRCYDFSSIRTRMNVLKVSLIDIVFLIFTIFLSIGVILCNMMF